MCVRSLGFVLLAWLPGLLHAQTACNPPILTNGYFVPQLEKYNHGQTLTYSCGNGFKPVVEGWWATVTCQNGKWTHNPQCVDSSACLPPAIENGKYEVAQRGWYENRNTIAITCEDGFDMKLRSGRIRCSNGRWSPLPFCERSIYACDEPDKIPHAVINQEAKEVYAHNSQLEYQCEDGYTTGRANHLNKITCQDRTWTEAQSCIPTVPPCVLDLRRLNIGETSQISIKDGETKKIDCTEWTNYWMLARCSNGGIEATECCHSNDIARSLCRFTRRL